MAAPYLEFDIARELEQLHGEAAWQSGHNAKTLVKYDGLRIVLIALKAHSSIPGHQTRGRSRSSWWRGISRFARREEPSTCAREGCLPSIGVYHTTWRRWRRVPFS